MQHKPTHKLLCWQNQGEEDSTLYGVDTQKTNWTARWGIFEDIFVLKLGIQNWRRGSQRAAKAAASPRLALPCSPGSGWGIALATQLHAGACQPRGGTPCLTHWLAKDPGNHHHNPVCGQQPLQLLSTLSSLPQLKQDLHIAAAVNSAQFMNARSIHIWFKDWKHYVMCMLWHRPGLRQYWIFKEQLHWLQAKDVMWQGKLSCFSLYGGGIQHTTICSTQVDGSSPLRSDQQSFFVIFLLCLASVKTIITAFTILEPSIYKIAHPFPVL